MHTMQSLHIEQNSNTDNLNSETNNISNIHDNVIDSTTNFNIFINNLKTVSHSTHTVQNPQLKTILIITRII